ncbi:MAG: hypothetical protein Q7S45_03720 [Candidatus Curtissbacteria bacterium]|nr:hypothetical protein [Candidatus Curtissbacteria bacterium]
MKISKFQKIRSRRFRQAKKLLSKTIPIWMVTVVLLNSVLATGFIEYYIMKKNFNNALVSLSKTTKSPAELVQILKQQVLPQGGYTLGVRWDDIGKKLLESGVIDKAKYEGLFVNDPEAKNQMKYLSQDLQDNMMINEKNAHFMVNTLWALGLVNKSDVLDKGSMKTYGKGNVMNFASTGGWNLGAKETSQLYSSVEIIKLTPEQQELVKKIAQNIYRPCCGNSTEFPDCNHGMAALGYIELAISQGVPEERIYKDILALNSFWFPQNYVELAAYMQKQGTQWKNVDAKLALSFQYSSAQGAQSIHQAVQDVPGLGSVGGSCGQ